MKRPPGFLLFPLLILTKKWVETSNASSEIKDVDLCKYLLQTPGDNDTVFARNQYLGQMRHFAVYKSGTECACLICINKSDANLWPRPMRRIQFARNVRFAVEFINYGSDCAKNQIDTRIFLLLKFLLAGR